MAPPMHKVAPPLAWSIWFNRNQVRHDKPRQSVAMIIHKARTLIEEFKVANF